MTNENHHLSSETLDLWLLAALDETEIKNAEKHVEKCSTCLAQWTERQKDQTAFKQFVYPKTVDAVTETVTGTSFQKRWKLWIPSIALAAAASIMVLVSPDVETNTSPYLGKKGAVTPWVELVAERKGQTQFQVKDGTRLRPKDRLEFVVEPGALPFVMVASKDGAGQFSVYFPFGRNESVKISSERQTLPGSIELDHVTGMETVWIIFSQKPLTSSEVEKAMRMKNPQALEASTVRSVQFEKEAM